MTKDETIARLSQSNFELSDSLKECYGVMHYIMSRIYSIGGPLNDNYYNYNNLQLKIFQDIVDNIKPILPEEEI